ncbi:MAG: hypothetical protein DRH07_11825 [Deltaproteobacteria bacterium]|nr:MAG: hypothetical protein DRH07_11825 [Deltaproteobacteria bacterium]
MEQNFKEIYRYLGAAYRHRLVAVIVALLVMTVVGAYTFTLPKIYQADSTVFIERSVIDRLVKGLAVTANINDKIRVLKYALLSRDLIVKTLEKIDSEIFTKSKAEQQDYIARLQKTIKIGVRGSDLFTVTLEGPDPAFVQNFVNTLVGQYVESNISLQRDEAYGANRFLEEQLQSFKQKLEKSEDAITAFRNKQGIYFSVDEKETLDEIKEYTREIEVLEQQIAAMKSRKIRLKEQLDGMSPTIESIFSIDMGEGDDLGNPQVAAMEQRLDDLRLRYTENYPEIVRIKFEINALRHRLATQTQDETVSAGTTGGSKMTSLNPLYLDVQQRLLEAEGELSDARSKKQNLARMIDKRKDQLKTVPETRKQLNVLIQERNSYQVLYQELLARMGKSEVSKQMEIGNKAATFRIVDAAILPETPVSPNLLKMLLLAVAAGLGAAAGIIFLFENLDNRLRDPGLLETYGVEVIAIIPNIINQQELSRRRRQDLLLVSFSGVYFCCFLGVFAFQLLSR